MGWSPDTSDCLIQTSADQNVQRPSVDGTVAIAMPKSKEGYIKSLFCGMTPKEHVVQQCEVVDYPDGSEIVTIGEEDEARVAQGYNAQGRAKKQRRDNTIGT